MDYNVLISYDLDCINTDPIYWEEFNRFMVEQKLWDKVENINSTLTKKFKDVPAIKEGVGVQIKELIEFDLNETIYQLDFLKGITYTFQFNNGYKSKCITLSEK